MKTEQTLLTPIFLVFLLTKTGFLFASEIDHGAYWREADIQVEQVINPNRINNENCYQTLETFSGCIDALRVFSASLEERFPELEINKKIEKPFSTPKLDFEKMFDELLIELNDANSPYISLQLGMAINRFLPRASGDPFERVIPRKLAMAQMNQADRSLVGIGISLKKDEESGDVIITNVLIGGPALKAGLLAEDRIFKVDDIKVQELSLSEITSLIRGEEGTPLVLTIKRNGQKFHVEMTREKIVFRNVDYKVYSFNHNSIGVIKIKSFEDTHACKSTEKSLEEIKKHNVDLVVLDLRDNGGGLMSQANCIVSLFLKRRKVVLRTRYLDSPSPFYRNRTFRSRGRQRTNLPVLTLINHNSASASEIVAGALQDHQRAIIIGERSFGKGTVQAARNGFEGNRNLWHFQTVQQFFLPSNRTNHYNGVTPDVDLQDSKDLVSSNGKIRYPHLFPLDNFQRSEWQQPRPEKMKTIKKCLEEKRVFSEQFAQRINEDEILLKITIGADCFLNKERGVEKKLVAFENYLYL